MMSASGRSRPSVSMLRLKASLLRSVGLGPIFSSAQRGFRHSPIERQPNPVNLIERFARQQAIVPEAVEPASVVPLAKPPMRQGARTKLRGVESPLHSGAQHLKDCNYRDAVRDGGRWQPIGLGFGRGINGGMSSQIASLTCPPSSSG